MLKVDVMMRRLEYLAREMPDFWFSYRNFLTIPSQATDTTIPPPVASVGRYVHEMAGGNITFTGHLARADVLEALGHRGYRPRLGESQMETRAMARQSNAYRYSTVLPALKPSRKGKKAKTPRLERLETRRAKRAGSDDESEENVVVEQPEEQPEKQPEQGPAKKVVTSDYDPARVLTMIIEIRKGMQAKKSEPPAALDESSTESDVSSKEHPIKGILNDKVQRKVQMYRVE